MPLPQPLDYQSAVQHPKLCFDDAELRRGVTTLGKFGLPRVASGAFASVYQVVVDGTPWAVRCFHRTHGDAQARYAAISHFLDARRVACLVPCLFLERGILVRGGWYPAVKMQWVDAPPLNVFVQANLGNRPRLDAVLNGWRMVCRSLEGERVAHGDLQHGNVLCAHGALTLVDYDGMCVPAYHIGRALEVGHPAYQHPFRTPDTDVTRADRFSELVIATSLRALAANPGLWERFDTGDNLLFRPSDFRAPASSELFSALSQSPDVVVATLSERLRVACQDIGKVASLDDETRAAERRSIPISTWWSDRLSRITPVASDQVKQPPPRASSPAATAIDQLDQRETRDPSSVVAQGSTSDGAFHHRLWHWLTGPHIDSTHMPDAIVPVKAGSSKKGKGSRTAARRADVSITCTDHSVAPGEIVTISVRVERDGLGVAGVNIHAFDFDPDRPTLPVHSFTCMTDRLGHAVIALEVPSRPGPLPIEVHVAVDDQIRRFTGELVVDGALWRPSPSWLRSIARRSAAQLGFTADRLVASETSGRFHRPTCTWAGRITGRRVYFMTPASAIAAGYLPCRVCRPS